jgi:exosome complex RNA-binding protein Rrp42 (RNase PH superfamily)
VAALLHFRLPEVSVTQQQQAIPNDTEGEGGKGGDVVIVHHSFEKEPSALPIHHVPICVSFGLFHEVRSMFDINFNYFFLEVNRYGGRRVAL